MPLTEAQDMILTQAELFVAERIPYLFGGKDPKKGLDCSGMVNACYAAAGITLSPGTVGLLTDGVPLGVQNGANAPFAQLQPFLQPCDIVLPTVDHCQLVAADVNKIHEIIEEPSTGFVATMRPEWAPTIYAVRRILPYSVPAGTTLWPGVWLSKGSVMNGTGVWRARLNALGFKSSGGSTFDASLDTATRAFQKAHHLEIDGCAGPLSWRAAFS